MIRFIDLRDQIIDIEDDPVRFAFYDTVTSCFLDLNGSQDWDRREDFIADHAASGIGEHESRKVQRFLGLMPEWVK